MIAPRTTLSAWLALAAALVHVGSRLGAVALAWGLTCAASVVVAADLWTLLRRVPPRLRWSAELQGEVRRAALLDVELERSVGVESVALRVPVEAGGPGVPSRPTAPRWSLVLWPRSRGVHSIDLALLHLRSPLGLWRRRVVVRGRCRVLVTHPVTRASAHLARGLLGPSSDGCRDGLVLAAVDAGTRMRGRASGASKIDSAARLVQLLDEQTRRRGGTTALVAYHEHLVWLAPADRRAKGALLAHALAGLSVASRPSEPKALTPALAALPGGASVVLLTDVSLARDAMGLAAVLRPAAARLGVTVVALADAAVRRAEASGDAEHRAVAHLVRRERALAVRLLRAAGVRVIDLGASLAELRSLLVSARARAPRAWRARVP